MAMPETMLYSNDLLSIQVVDNLQNLQSNHYRPSAVLDSLLTQAHDRKNEKRGLEIVCPRTIFLAE